MAKAYLVHYCGKIIETTVTESASVAENWVLNIQSGLSEQKINIVGFNCKWKPHPIESMSGRITTLQLCVDTRCLVLQISRLNNIPESIKHFFSDSNVVFVGIEVKKMVTKLQNEYGLNCTNKIDVRHLVKMHFPVSFCMKPGLKALASQLVGLHPWRSKKGHLNLDMETVVLEKEQIMFACVDAYVSYRIGQKLLLEMQ
ncbi:hypothetical protein SLA2020_373670 [Shorea laevis]